MARVAALRRSLGRPTVFNLVGPLCNPASATVQVIGVGRRAARRPLATAAAILGLPRAVVVSGAIGGVDGAAPSGWLDEVSLFGPTDVIDVRAAAPAAGDLLDDGCATSRLPENHIAETHIVETHIAETQWTPEAFGLTTLPVGRFAELHVDAAAGSAAAIREVLSGQDGARRDVVVLNAAALLRSSATAGDAPAARELAEEAIDSGRASLLLQSLARRTQAFPRTA
jgi:anthranilate phosphoribosyltransferase